MADAIPDDTILTFDAAAHECGCCKKTFRHHVEAGEVAFIWIGKRRKFMLGDIKEFKRARRVKCPSIKSGTSIGSISGSRVVDFEAALKHRTKARRNA